MVIDPVFGEPAAGGGEALGPGGRLVNLGGAAGDRTDLSSAVLRGRMISVLGYTNNAITPIQRAAALGAVLGLAADGRLAVAHDVQALSDCARAWHAAAGGTARSSSTPGVSLARPRPAHARRIVARAAGRTSVNAVDVRGRAGGGSLRP